MITPVKFPISRKIRFCIIYQNNEIGDEFHFIMHCSLLKNHWKLHIDKELIEVILTFCKLKKK
jgi:hypothetical protein